MSPWELDNDENRDSDDDNLAPYYSTGACCYNRPWEGMGFNDVKASVPNSKILMF